MLRPSHPTAICPMCGRPGVHRTVDECLRDLRTALADAQRRAEACKTREKA